MERMLVVVFDDEAKAYQGRSSLRQLELEGSIAFRAGAVVAKNSDGTTTVKHYDDVEPVGTLVGTSVGGLIGLLGGPIGATIGAVSGLTVGALSDAAQARVGADFVEEVSKTLTPGKVAVVAEIDEMWTTPVDSRLKALGGTVMRRELADVEQQLHDEEVAAMKADVARLKEDMGNARAERRAQLKEKIDRLEQRIDEQQKKAQEWLVAFQKHQQERRELVKTNAANLARAAKDFVKTPPF